jgi:N4-(beta-N-acetylglucosaminyl)-L-asparaginase
MADKLNRREFMATTAGAGLLAASRPLASPGAPAVIVQGSSRPVIVGSANGHRFKNGGAKTCVETAWEMMVRGDDVLDAVIAGVNIVELDPLEDSVGYGGLPNADGVVQLDSCCMHGPRKKAGGVGASENVKTPSRLAKAVMERTDHHLLVGKDVTTFARNLGFELTDDLNTPNSRAKWLQWKQQTDPLHYIKDPLERERALQQVTLDMVRAGLINENHMYGTINCNGVNANGDICGVTTTSGWAFKIPGRLGDSPILGAGLYVDGDVGAAGSTGRGEANLFGLCSFLIVDEMRRGKSPKDAGMEACRRIQANTIDTRLLNSRGLPNFSVNFYIVNKRGEYAGVGLYGTTQFAVCDAKGPRFERSEPLLPGGPND